ncbi:topology modulation protein [Sporosarcina sp. FSL W7-1349]|uniref:topology modulation protein n=1 Tax=Sporosarcina sp. FSL W7-1349 TaxID=2921561 RepID=UPI0030F4FE7E
MEKIMVIGVSPGAGKSTFARQLGERTGIPVTHLDTLYWKPGWEESSNEEFLLAQQAIVQEDRWIVEGNYSGTFSIREPRADTVIYLELPRWLCLYRVLKRRVQYHGKTRDDMAEGCPEKIDWEFLKFILSTYGPRKDKMRQRLQRYAKEGKTVHQLKTRRHIDGFLNTFTGIVEI